MGVGGQRQAPAALPPGKTRYPLYRRLGGSQGRSRRVRKILLRPVWAIINLFSTTQQEQLLNDFVYDCTQGVGREVCRTFGILLLESV
jgi:hypothetical protein